MARVGQLGGAPCQRAHGGKLLSFSSSSPIPFRALSRGRLREGTHLSEHKRRYCSPPGVPSLPVRGRAGRPTSRDQPHSRTRGDDDHRDRRLTGGIWPPRIESVRPKPFYENRHRLGSAAAWPRGASSTRPAWSRGGLDRGWSTSGRTSHGTVRLGPCFLRGIYLLQLRIGSNVLTRRLVKLNGQTSLWRLDVAASGTTCPVLRSTGCLRTPQNARAEPVQRLVVLRNMLSDNRFVLTADRVS